MLAARQWAVACEPLALPNPREFKEDRMNKELSIAFGLALLASSALAGAPPPAPTLFTVTPLVSDQPGMAPNIDPDLVNPWGLSQFPGDPIWVSDNGTDLSTLYDPNSGVKSPLIVNIPMGAPTGTVAIPAGNGFVVSEGANSGESAFLFDTESGAIEGWNPNVDLNNAIVAYDGSPAGSVYKGLAYDPASNHIFAADFHNNKVEIRDNTFALVKAFTDRNLPKRYAPFDVAVFNGKLYVAFALREKNGDDEVDGKGLGYVDVFTTKGKFVKTLIANGPLNAPWGLAIAPSNFGSLAGTLLVGNFGDGRINAFDPNTGTLIETLHSSKRKEIAIDGLWALDDTGNGSITFSAGPGGEAHGLIGLITPQ
jgi:uncharacterized protein (TIGR03118 family)